MQSLVFSYSRYVTKSVLKVDTLLKVIMTPEEPAEEFIKHYLLLVPCQSFSDFQKVLDLKVRLLNFHVSGPLLFRGMGAEHTLSFSFSFFLYHISSFQGVRRGDQNNLLDLFLARTSTAQGLSDTSFLTSLDMDPTASLTSPPHSGFSSPIPGMNNNLNIFGSTGSGGNSRVSTPSGIRSVDGKEALQRMATRLGIASRLFSTTGGN